MAVQSAMEEKPQHDTASGPYPQTNLLPQFVIVCPGIIKLSLTPDVRHAGNHVIDRVDGV